MGCFFIMKKYKDLRTWVLEDHLCKKCGGRILRCISGGGPTGGGNPIFKCADCGIEMSDMGPGCLCWCGFSHRGQRELNPYLCQPFYILDTKPELKTAFLNCGCDPDKGEVGILLESDLRRIMNESA